MPYLRMRALSWVLLAAASGAALVTGCLQPQSSRCGELYCPEGSVCSPAHDRCVSPAALSACSGASDGDPCTMAGAPGGQCRAGVCTPVVCGDGIVAGDEVCDDGNTISGDGCSADCRSDESCGNGIVDSAAGEDCDNGPGNADVPNAACRSNCKRQRCGDGIVDDKAAEDCDGAPSKTDLRDARLLRRRARLLVGVPQRHHPVHRRVRRRRGQRPRAV